MSSRFSYCLPVLLLTLICTPVHAFRCGTRIIVTGDSKPLVQDKCGEPEFTEVIRDGYKSRDYIRETRWYYRKRSGKLRPVVIFDSNGRVVEVRMEK